MGKVVAKKSLEDPWVWGVVKHFGLDVLGQTFWEVRSVGGVPAAAADDTISGLELPAGARTR